MESISLRKLSENLGSVPLVGAFPIQNETFQTMKASDLARISVDQDGFRTVRLIRLHCLRFAHKWISLVIMLLMQWQVVWENAVLIVYEIEMTSHSKVQLSLHAFVSYRLGYYWWYVWTALSQMVPITTNILWRTFGCYKVPRLEDFPDVLQPLGTVPSVLTLVLTVTPFASVVGSSDGPPEIPQPYLNADRKIVVPLNKDVQRGFALRNEWITQAKTHLAAERVRLLNQLALFILWSCALPFVGSVTVFESQGLLWNDGDATQTKTRIRNFLVNEFKFFLSGSTCVSKVLPRITLIDNFTNEIFMSFDVSELDLQDGCPVALGTPNCSVETCTRNEMIVYLQDERIRQKMMDTENTLNWQTSLPPLSKLTIVPSANVLTGGPVTMCEPAFAETSIVYKRQEQFGFRMFLNALLHYNQVRSHSLKDENLPAEEQINRSASL